MRRIRIDRPGSRARTWLEDAPTPSPGPGQVRVRVQAAGLNYADTIIRLGLYASAKQLHGYPITPGFEVAGTIDALGEGVTGWREGDAVIGVSLFNGWASHVVLEAGQVFARPDALSAAEAAAIPTVFLTAWFMVHQQLHPRPGERWLVHSAAGGVGQALLQLARLAGAEAVGVVGGEHKRAAALAAGAREVLLRDATLWPRARALAPAGYHAVFDANGVATLGRSFEHLAPTGRLCIYGFASMLPRDGRLNWLRLAWDWWRTPRFSPLAMTQSNRSVLACNLSFLQAESARLAEGMCWLLERFADGRLVAPPVTTWPLAEAGRAMDAIAGGATVGKLVLLPGDDAGGDAG
jgi:NADPH:quinone reductase-like Zn-dependent oxidoreductase